jgi:hypothetical protein
MGPLIRLIILNVIVYAICKFVVPNIPGSAPLPASLVFLYLMLTTSGFIIFATLSAESKEAFWGPIQRFLTGENIGGLQAVRYGVLILFPLLVGWQTYNSTAVVMRRHQKTGRFTRRRQANIPACRTQFQRHRTPSSRGRASMPHSVPPATAETLMARVRRPGDSILPRLTSPIQRRSPCSRKAISSGGSRRAASASRSKGCHGNPRCLAGKSNFPTNGSGKSSWASTMERINRRGRGSRRG